MSSACDLTDAELHQIRETLTMHYRKDVEIHLAHRDLILDEENDRKVIFPTVLWHELGTNFVIFKTGKSEYRARFFYTPHDQFGTGTTVYNDLDTCVAELLQAQSNHEQ